MKAKSINIAIYTLGLLGYNSKTNNRQEQEFAAIVEADSQKLDGEKD